jgi:hypothetical protein
VHLQLASSFPRRFGEAVSRCRKIGEAGSQQLLLDTHAVRSLLLGFPTSGDKFSASLQYHAATLSLNSTAMSALIRLQDNHTGCHQSAVV